MANFIYVCICYLLQCQGKKTALTLLMDLLRQYVKVIAQGLWRRTVGIQSKYLSG